MRPTFLQFRNPKEKTPDPYDIKITCTGSSANLNNKHSPTFSRCRRFQQYEEQAKKTGYLIGPGSYKLTPKRKIKGGLIYKPYHIKRDPVDLIYIGQSLITRNSSENHPEKKLESRSASANEKHRLSHHMFHSRKNSPFAKDFSKNSLL